MLAYFDENYTEPVLETYTASKWDISHHTQKALEKLVQKENEKLLKKFNDKERVHNTLRKCIQNSLSNLPDPIYKLFKMVLKGQVDHTNRIHKMYLDAKSNIQSMYDKKVDGLKSETTAYGLGETLYISLERKYNPTSKRGYYYVSSLEDLQKRYPNLNHPDYNFEQMYVALREYYKIKKADIVLVYDGPQNAINHVLEDTVERLVCIATQIKEHFNGVMPKTCITDVNFGVGGHFNGRLEENGIKVSFKSFLAGGYNIQREHIRFKITRLK